MWASARETQKARGNTCAYGVSQTPSKNERKRIKPEFLALARLLLLTSNPLLPSTVYINIDKILGFFASDPDPTHYPLPLERINK